MKKIMILTKDYYDRPEYYPFMPPSIFNALEEAELKGALLGEEITVEVSEDDFNKMIKDFDEHNQKIKNGS